MEMHSYSRASQSVAPINGQHQRKRIPIQPSRENLESVVVDEKIGLIHNFNTRIPGPGEPPVFTAASRIVYMPNADGIERWPVEGGAAALTANHAQIAGLCEGIERYCLFAGDPDTFLVDTYRNLSSRFDILSPEACPLFHPSQYPAVGYAPFERDTPLAWVWGFSLTRKKPLLVPADLVYLRNTHSEGEAEICNTISTGAACGTSYADAIVRGIYEIVERDALMVMWLNRHPCPRLRITQSSALGKLLTTRFNIPDLTHEFIWMSNDFGIHACMAILLDGKLGARRTFVGLAAHLDPQRAAMSALIEAHEVRLGISRFQETMPVVQNPNEITNIHRHAYYYAQGDRTPLLDFLLQGSEEVDLGELENASQGNSVADLQTRLEKCALASEEVIVVDITQEDIRSLGLKVVRVIMPGMQRLTCEHNKPFLGSHRLYEVPVRLGWRTRPVEISEVNPDPHPFI